MRYSASNCLLDTSSLSMQQFTLTPCSQMDMIELSPCDLFEGREELFYNGYSNLRED